VFSNSRAGQVLTLPYPVTTAYMRPRERVLFNASRDANPFFHYLESLWMLAGRNDVEWLERYNGSIGQFSDDGKTFHGAYGYRWRSHFQRDQIDQVIALLRTDPDTRRAVLGMWDPRVDSGEGKDFPCNMQVVFRMRLGSLDMTVYNRSNDIIWGAYGANVVHMSILQEYVAYMLGVPVGIYYQVSNDYHAYTKVFNALEIPDPGPVDPYQMREVTASYLFADRARIMPELWAFMNNPYDVSLTEPFLCGIAVPMVQAWELFKGGNLTGAIKHVERIESNDWKKACHEWLVRRLERKANRRQRPTVAYSDNDTRPKRS